MLFVRLLPRIFAFQDVTVKVDLRTPMNSELFQHPLKGRCIPRLGKLPSQGVPGGRGRGGKSVENSLEFRGARVVLFEKKLVRLAVRIGVQKIGLRRLGVAPCSSDLLVVRLELFLALGREV